MAKNHQTPAPEERIPSEAAVPESPGAAPGDVVVDFEKINDLVKQRNAAVRDAVEQAKESTEAEKSPEGADLPSPGAESKADNRQEWEKTSAGLDAEQKKLRRGRPPKEAAEQTGPKGDKKPAKKTPRKGRPPKADKAATDKAATDKAAKPVRDKVSQGKKVPRQGRRSQGDGSGAYAAARSRQHPPPSGTGAGGLSEIDRASLIPYVPRASLQSTGR